MGYRTDLVRDVLPSGWDGHQLLIAGVHSASRAVLAWADAGLRRDEQLIYAADARYPSVERLAAALAASGLDMTQAAADGQLAVVDAARFYSVSGYEDLVTQALRRGYRGMRSYGGPHAAADVLGPVQFEAFERMLERMWTTRGVTAVCSYDPKTVTDKGELDRAIGRHSSGWSEQLVHAHNLGAGRLRLTGEIDLSNDYLLAAVLAAAARTADAELVVDCTDLRYMSVCGWRAVAAATAPFRDRGGRVRLAGLTTIAARMLQVLGYARVFDLEPCP
jgi:anti-anti-sigma factor